MVNFPRERDCKEPSAASLLHTVFIKSGKRGKEQSESLLRIQSILRAKRKAA